MAPFIKDKDQIKSDDGITPYASAAFNGHLDVMKYLEQFKVEVNLPNKIDRSTPIHYAAAKGHLEIVKHLAPKLKNKNQPAQNGFTPLQIAAQNGHHEIVEYLSDFVDNPNEPTFNAQKLTPLKLASRNKHSKTVKVLLEKICERLETSSIDIMHTFEN